VEASQEEIQGCCNWEIIPTEATPLASTTKIALSVAVPVYKAFVHVFVILQNIRQ
jgi:hypothetical protein